VTVSITAAYTRLFGIPPAHASATVVMKVVKGQAAVPPSAGRIGGRLARAKLSAVAAMTNPPESALPDLVPLPAWGIRTTHAAGRDLLNFAATVWVGGNGQLDVQGFRVKSSPVMSAYQYFWQDGRVIGRARVGTMGFDSLPGHNHWHFEQFAAYKLLGSGGKLVLRSQKNGFLHRAHDPVDLLLPNAVWQPSFVGFAGQCGALPRCGCGNDAGRLGRHLHPVDRRPGVRHHQTAQRHVLRPGDGQPRRHLHETTTANDVTVRKVIISGTRATGTSRCQPGTGSTRR
jgi:hypothetical protein